LFTINIFVIFLETLEQFIAAGQWFSTGTLVSSTNETDDHDIFEIMLKVALNTNPNTGIHCFVESQTNKGEDNSNVQSQVSLSTMPMVPEQVLRVYF
jgi:hypothetical protein